MSQSFVALSANSDQASDFPNSWNLFRDSILSLHSGTSRPSYAAAGTLWYDTSTQRINFFDGSGDVFVCGIDENNHYLKAPSGSGSNTLPSATTVDLGSVDENFITITGTVTISDFGTSMKPGQVKFCSVSGSFILTHDGLTLNLPGASDIQTANGDSFIVVCSSSGRYRVVSYSVATSRYATLDSPSLTGNPTAPTQAINNRTTRLATTAFVIPEISLASPGYYVHPSGMIEQWGGSVNTGIATLVTFPKAFTGGGIRHVICTGLSSDLGLLGPKICTTAPTTTEFYWGAEVNNTVVTAAASVQMAWRAIGS